MAREVPQTNEEKIMIMLREQTQVGSREGSGILTTKTLSLCRSLTNRGKIFSRKRSGNCAHCQRKVNLAIKRARFMGLLPYTA